MRPPHSGLSNAHPPDQRAQVRVDLRTASKGVGFPTPVPAEAGSVPSHEGLGADNRDGLEDCRKPPIQLDEEQAITIREPDTSAHLPPQYDELMPQRRVLCLSRLFDLNGDTNRASQRQNSAIIVADVRRFVHVDGVLGTDRCVNDGISTAAGASSPAARSGIMSWEMVRTLSAPPRTRSNLEISLRLAKGRNWQALAIFCSTPCALA